MFYFMPLHVSSTCAHHQEVKIALHSLWYHHTYRCDDTRGCVMQDWPPDDEHMCSKHVEVWYKLIAKQKFCASSWLITQINILTRQNLNHFIAPEYITTSTKNFYSLKMASLKVETFSMNKTKEGWLKCSNNTFKLPIKPRYWRKERKEWKTRKET